MDRFEWAAYAVVGILAAGALTCVAVVTVKLERQDPPRLILSAPR